MTVAMSEVGCPETTERGLATKATLDVAGKLFTYTVADELGMR